MSSRRQTNEDHQVPPNQLSCHLALFNSLIKNPRLACTLKMRQLRWAHVAGKDCKVKRKRYSRKFQRMAVESMRSSDNIGDLAKAWEQGDGVST